MTADYLSPVELSVYISGYISLVSYGTWQLYLYGSVIRDESHPSAFRDGNTVGGLLPLVIGGGGVRQQEIDIEWDTWALYFRQHWSWFVAYLCLAELIRRFGAKSRLALRIANASLGVAMLAYDYGLCIGAVFVLNIVAFVRVARCAGGWKRYVWLMAIAWMAVLNANRWVEFDDSPRLQWLLESEAKLWELNVIAAWSCLRLLSASLDIVEAEAERRVATDSERAQPQHDEDKQATVLDVIGYVLYVPTLFYGPIVVFRRYRQMIDTAGGRRGRSTTTLRQRGRTLIERVGGIVWRIVGMQVLCHLFYANVLQTNVELCERMPLMALYAFGFCMGTSFYLKYRVAYGGTLAMAEFGGMETPALPKFIGRVHLYSDMWKWFDRGLYEFLFRYIYSEWCTAQSSLARRLGGSAATFGFVFLFHGTEAYIGVWSALNFVCIVLEMLGRRFCVAARGGRLAVDRWLGVRWQRRLVALAGSQLFVLAVLSNFYFFTGCEVGWVFMRRTYAECGWLQYAVLTGCAVCIYHTSEWWKRNERWENQRRMVLEERDRGRQRVFAQC